MVRTWTFDGPDDELLLKADVASALRISIGQVDSLVERGLLPPPMQFAARSEACWDARDVIAFLWLQLRCGSRPRNDPEGEHE